ncbi:MULTISPECIES: hypothetical protein [Erythrobacteraceae]|uniref:Uncharacterized protein n=2 Tax=Erythrobacteraceae TaxID=335929 RepID=A0A7G6VTQ2_9SPHN|nr:MULTISPECIES: hypothetical protein [Erythrobacteraceae]MAM37552.1 hypothetical protein [Erythrobacter sp.]MXO54398.1 hypothetical protein [Qipengyuania pelagi]QNE05117.1 hypothetical protein H4O24_14720 [Croceicoccus marinus]
MSDTADYDFDPHFEQDPVNWALDPLEDESGGILAVHRVALVRIACVAAETGARMQRDGLAEDPVGWMVSPLELFEGRAPIEACMERSACSKAILLHGLGLGLDADPAVMDRLLFDHSASLESGHG